MSKPIRFGSAISLIALTTVIAGCAAPQQHASNASSQPSGEVGLATRALAALTSGDSAAAISFAERAAEKTPDDATVRTLLGNTYLAGGRFASAEQAFKDSLSIQPNQSQVVLKVALAQIGQGKNAEAMAVLQAARNALDPADFGLAVALAGHPSDAVSVLEPVARTDGADARVRQNLALAYALAGDWTNARTIAAQDVPADQLDGRIHQWMKLANPARPGDQLAALIGVSPAASDPGEPTRLALTKPVVPLAAAAPGDAPLPQVAEAVPPPLPPLAEGVPPPLPPVDEARVSAAAPPPLASLESPAAPAFTPEVTAPPPPIARPARIVRAALPKVAVRRAGKSGAVVQIGAYSNVERVAAAWSSTSRRYGALRAYTPMSARFDSPKGTFYRLSVKGFASVTEANALCGSIRRGGGSCFVRQVAGDTPVQLASR